MTFNDVITQRYSCRSFSSQSIAQEKIDRILAAGRIAPTAVNKQPVHIWVVSRPEILEAIKGVTRSNYGAPLLLVVGCRPSEAWVRRYDGKNGVTGNEKYSSIGNETAAKNVTSVQQNW